MILSNYSKIGTMSNGKLYYYDIPYTSSDKFKEYVSGERDFLGKGLFGYDRDEIVDTMYAVQFSISKYDGIDDVPEYWIHYHMMSTDGYQNCYHPTLRDKEKKRLVFYSLKEANDFLIKFMEEYEITEINTEEMAKDIQSTTKEVKRYMSILNRITDALNYR